MKIPDPIVVQENGAPFEGIINEIKKYSSDPISENIVVPSSSGNSAGHNCAVTWAGVWSSMPGAANAFLEIRFPGRFLFATHYTIRGCSDSCIYQKKWILFGFNSNEVSDASKWTTLAENESTADTFCGSSSTCSGGKESTIFSIKPINKGFEYVRFKTTASSSSSIYFITSAIEFFGRLSSSPNPMKNKCYVGMQKVNLSILRFQMIALMSYKCNGSSIKMT